MRSVLVFLAIPVALLASCGGGTTSLRSVWSDYQFRSRGYDKILVLGMSPREHVRREFEYSMKESLTDIGVEAVASLEVLFHNEQLSRETFDEAFQDMDIDAVLVSRLLAIDTETYWVGGTMPYPYYSDFYGYYGAAYGYVYSPGYLAQATVVRVETNLYDVESAKLAWSGISETFDPETATDVIEPLGRAVIHTLVGEGFLPKPR